MADIRASGGKAVEGVLADAGAAEGAAAILKAVPSVDILVNNLGIYEMKAFADIPDEDWLHLFDVNVMSGVRLSRGYFPGMLARNRGPGDLHLIGVRPGRSPPRWSTTA
ncbi:SDR family NAD(P)-dependent oxidoreductase [Caulobacter segnis]